MKLLQFPQRDVTDVPAALRRLADDIEAGKFGEAPHLAWVIDCGDSRLSIGLLGESTEPGAVAYYLYGKAMRKLDG